MTEQFIGRKLLKGRAARHKLFDVGNGLQHQIDANAVIKRFGRFYRKGLQRTVGDKVQLIANERKKAGDREGYLLILRRKKRYSSFIISMASVLEPTTISW